MPTLEKLFRQDPEALPFMQPVDPVLLQIPVIISSILFCAILEPSWFAETESMPNSMILTYVILLQDYFDIVKKPMDMSTIRRKLETGQYKDPWEYVDDVWLMFENAWLYNRKTSRVYKYCSKVSRRRKQ